VPAAYKKSLLRNRSAEQPTEKAAFFLIVVIVGFVDRDFRLGLVAVLVGNSAFGIRNQRLVCFGFVFVHRCVGCIRCAVDAVFDFGSEYGRLCRVFIAASERNRIRRNRLTLGVGRIGRWRRRFVAVGAGCSVGPF